MNTRGRVLPVVLAAVIAACQGGAPGGSVSLDLDTRNADQMARFYLGAYMDSSSVSRVLGPDQGSSLNMVELAQAAPGLTLALADAAQDGVVSREEFLSAVGDTYAAAIGQPESWDGFLDAHGLSLQDGSWISFEVSGSMTRYRRKTSIPREAVRAALSAVSMDGRELHYPIGTVILGEHYSDGAPVELTAMIRRGDGFWDYVAYDSTGKPLRTIAGTPEALAVPGDCFGCHYGTRLFEPERSFPAQVADGPWGPRGIFVEPRLMRADATAFLDEHRRRSDGILGLYGTVYLADVLDRSERGLELDSLDQALAKLVQ